MSTKALNIAELSEQFDQILDCLSIEEVKDWLNIDDQDQLSNMLKGEIITVSSYTHDDSFVICQFEETDFSNKYNLAA